MSQSQNTNVNESFCFRFFFLFFIFMKNSVTPCKNTVWLIRGNKSQYAQFFIFVIRINNVLHEIFDMSHIQSFEIN